MKATIDFIRDQVCALDENIPILSVSEWVDCLASIFDLQKKLSSSCIVRSMQHKQKS